MVVTTSEAINPRYIYYYQSTLTDKNKKINSVFNKVITTDGVIFIINFIRMYIQDGYTYSIA